MQLALLPLSLGSDAKERTPDLVVKKDGERLTGRVVCVDEERGVPQDGSRTTGLPRRDVQERPRAQAARIEDA